MRLSTWRSLLVRPSNGALAAGGADISRDDAGRQAPAPADHEPGGRDSTAVGAGERGPAAPSRRRRDLIKNVTFGRAWAGVFARFADVQHRRSPGRALFPGPSARFSGWEARLPASGDLLADCLRGPSVRIRSSRSLPP
jgi:hypothetical protein